MQSTLSNPKRKVKLVQFEAIGTHWSIEADTILADNLQIQIRNRIEEFDRTYSRFRDDSLVGELRKRAGTFTFPGDVMALIDFYADLYASTKGAVTPLVGGVLDAMGYDKDYSLKQKQTERVEKWQEVMHWDGVTVTTSQPIVLDVGAAGKGYLVDVVGELLEYAGIKTYVIDASGDVRYRGADEYITGLEDPSDATRVIGTVPVKNASICASATNRRAWGNGLHHIIDGNSGKPTSEIVATWVIADSTMMADGLATALFFVAADALTSFGDFQFVRLFSDGKVEHSGNFVGELFI